MELTNYLTILLMKNRENMILQNGDEIIIESENNSDNLKTTTGGIQFWIVEEDGNQIVTHLTRREATELAKLIRKRK